MDSPILQTNEGTIPFPVEGETFQTWYKVVGQLDTGQNKRPLVVLHGGPGLSHDYMLPIADLTRLYSTPVIFYDQIGNSRSTHLRDKEAGFWTIELFIDELKNVLSHFGISDNYDILGHSWGGMLATEFAVRAQPEGLKHLVIANSLTEMRLWNQSHDQLRKNLPQEVQHILRDNEKKGTIWSQEYREAMVVFYSKYACLMQPWPQELIFSMQQPHDDHTVLQNMFSGVLKEWTINDRLPLVRVPTLVITGEHDMGQRFVSEAFFQRLPHVKGVHFEMSSHVPQWEERTKYALEVNRFLNDE